MKPTGGQIEHWVWFWCRSDPKSACLCQNTRNPYNDGMWSDEVTRILRLPIVESIKALRGKDLPPYTEQKQLPSSYRRWGYGMCRPWTRTSGWDEFAPFILLWCISEDIIIKVLRMIISSGIAVKRLGYVQLVRPRWNIHPRCTIDDFHSGRE